jgi:addiction module HigA family antidote
VLVLVLPREMWHNRKQCSRDRLVQHQHRTGTYQKVYDARKRRIRGLWRRGDRFYALLAIPHAAPRVSRNEHARRQAQRVSFGPVVLEKRGITADTALRLARYFGTTAELWTGLQADHDLRLARYEKQRQIERDVEPPAHLQSVAAC